MPDISYIAQPSKQTTLDALADVLERGNFDCIDIAVAYITAGGIFDLVEIMTSKFGDDWDAVNKNWLTSFDYCRTEPIALQTLLSLPASKVRIFDASRCLKSKSSPFVPFHPKAYLFSNSDTEYFIAGSGNLSRSGLARGVEAGLVVGYTCSSEGTEDMIQNSVSKVRGWYEDLWSNAEELTPDLYDQYKTLYENVDNLKNPTPTEDDTASSDTSTKAISSKDLKRLRVCSNMWIETGNITKNRGPKLPGNQLMMKRMSRVFFGFSAKDLVANSPVGSVFMSFSDKSLNEYSLTYSDNKMDKLVLPIPDVDGPSKYDNSILVFETIKPRCFRLRILNLNGKSKLKRKSTAVGGAFKMSSGREWGVF